MIEVTCPNCHDTLSVPEAYAGQRGTCKKCNGPVVVPALNAAASGGIDFPDDLASALDASLTRERPRPVVAPNSMGDKLGPLLKPLGIVLGIVAVAAIVLGGAAFLPKLGFGSGPSPETVAGSFLTALKTGDLQQCKPHMTEKAWQTISASPMPAGAMPLMENFTVGAATTTADKSQVAVQVTQMGMTVSQDVLLRKENGPWRVYGIKVAPMPGMSMTMDFENPAAMMDEAKKMMQGLPPEVMQQMGEAMQKQMAR